MFGFGLVFQLLHDGFFPFLSVGGGRQVHQRNGMAAAGLLFQLGHRRLFLAVIEDAVDHAVIVLHSQFRVFQRILREETELRELTDSTLAKLRAMSDAEFAGLELYPDFDE